MNAALARPPNYWAVWLSIATLVVYAVGYLVAGRTPTNVVFGSLVAGVAATVMLQYGAGAIPAIRSGAHEAGDRSILSTWLVFSILFLYFVYVVIFQVAGTPGVPSNGLQDWLRQSPISGFLTVGFFLAGMYAIFAPISTEAKMPKPVMAWTIVAAVVGGLVTGILLTLAFVGVLNLG